MFKVFAFLKRNTALLTHDEYRAGHVGYHCCNSRRLKNIRGYFVNVWANQDLHTALGPLYGEITKGEPAGFKDKWDGFPEVYFDDREAWTQASTPEPTRAMADGLALDPDWSFADGPFLFDAIKGTDGEFRSNHLHMEEHVIVPPERPEYKLTKLMQFFRRNPALSDDEFRAGVLERYAPLSARLAGLHGYVVNFRDRDPEAAIRDFYPADSWRFSEEGIAFRHKFCALFDGANELHFDSLDAFASARTNPELHGELLDLERELFEAVWYVEVDENMIVMPNRDPAPNFYYR